MLWPYYELNKLLVLMKLLFIYLQNKSIYNSNIAVVL